MSGSSPAPEEQDEATAAELEQELFSPEDEGLEDAEAPSRSELGEDPGELDFTYDDTLLQADEEEEAAVSETPQKQSQEHESERSSKEQYDRAWGANSANAFPVHKHDVPAHSRAGNIDLTDRQQMLQRQRYPQRGILANRGDVDKRGQSLWGYMQDQGSRQPEGHRGRDMPSVSGMRPSAPAERPGTSSSHSRPAPPAHQQPDMGEFDPNILMNFMRMVEDANQGRPHDQMQTQMPLVPPDLARSLMQMQQQQHPQQAPGSVNNSLPHQRNPNVPPPRPPSGPPPAGPHPRPRHPGIMFPNVPDFSPMTSGGMDYPKFQGPRPPHGPTPPGWTLSHGMDSSGRLNASQEPTLAAGMVWDAPELSAPSFSGREPAHSQADHFQQRLPGQRGESFPRPSIQHSGPRPPPRISPPSVAPAPNKPSKDALAAARAKFEQQQRENERIAENNKRQRLGLPLERPTAPAPGYQETEIEKLKRQIAEKEAAAKAAQAQQLARKAHAAPSTSQPRQSSTSPAVAPAQDRAHLSPSPQQRRTQHRDDIADHGDPVRSRERSRPRDSSSERVRESGHSRKSKHRGRSRDRSRERLRRSSNDNRSGHPRQNGSNSHHSPHESRHRDRSRERVDRRTHDQRESEGHRSPYKSSTQASQHSQRSSRSPLTDRQRHRHSSDAARPR